MRRAALEVVAGTVPSQLPMPGTKLVRVFAPLSALAAAKSVGSHGSKLSARFKLLGELLDTGINCQANCQIYIGANPLVDTTSIIEHWDVIPLPSLRLKQLHPNVVFLMLIFST